MELSRTGFVRFHLTTTYILSVSFHSDVQKSHRPNRSQHMSWTSQLHSLSAPSKWGYALMTRNEVLKSSRNELSLDINDPGNVDYSTQYVQIYARTSDCSGDTEKVVRCPPTYFLLSTMLHATCAIPFVFTPSALTTLTLTWCATSFTTLSSSQVRCSPVIMGAEYISVLSWMFHFSYASENSTEARWSRW